MVDRLKSTAGEGVRGTAKTRHHAGVVGTNTKDGWGIYGKSDDGNGVVGESKKAIGVVGLSSKGTGVLDKATPAKQSMRRLLHPISRRLRPTS